MEKNLNETISHKKIETDETIKYSEVLSVIEDIKITKQYCVILKELLNQQKTERNDIIQRSLWESALISFFRCFKGGQRKFGLKKDIFNHIKGETSEFFKYLENTRDKHIAHSANTMSNVIVGITTDKDLNVLDTSYMTTRHIGENEHNIDMFIILLDEAYKYCIKNAEILHKAVLEYTRTLDKNEIAKLKDLQFEVPDILNAAKKYRKQS